VRKLGTPDGFITSFVLVPILTYVASLAFAWYVHVVKTPREKRDLSEDVRKPFSNITQWLRTKLRAFLPTEPGPTSRDAAAASA